VSALDDILGALPAEQISRQVGASPDEVRTAAAAVLPALLGGLQANAGDPSGAQSIVSAVARHPRRRPSRCPRCRVVVGAAPRPLDDLLRDVLGGILGGGRR
jgi:hypothetical protein